LFFLINKFIFLWLSICICIMFWLRFLYFKYIFYFMSKGIPERVFKVDLTT
jgi:hypothetical protein